MTNIYKVIKQIFHFVLIYILITGTLTYIASIIFKIDLNNRDFNNRDLFEAMILTTFELIGTLVSIVIFLKYFDKENISHLKRIGFFYQDILLGTLTSFAIMSIGFFLLLLTHQIRILSTSFDITKLTLSISVFFAIALMEEALVRGFILKKLMRRFSNIVALLISAIIFSFLHIFNPHVGLLPIVNLFFAGILLGIPYVFTKNLSGSVGMHFAWNLFQCLFGFNVSGSGFHVFFTQEVNKENIWTGGAFGFEGSILCLVLQIGAIIFTYHFYNGKKRQQIGFRQVNMVM